MIENTNVEAQTAETSRPRVLPAVLVLLMMLGLAGCRRYAMDDPALKPFNNMYEVERDQYGLGPLPKNAKVRIDRSTYAESGYDVMLGIYANEIRYNAKEVHHVAFRLDRGSYKWVGELEQCEGPREYRSADGRMQEEVTISYFQHVPTMAEGVHATYVGPDSLTNKEISIVKGRELLKSWGCM